MAIFLDRIDSVPIASNTQFDPQFSQWLWILVDALNENMSDIQNAFNLFTANSFTDTEITDLHTAGQIGDGIILYDTINNVYVGKQGGSLVKFTTTPYP